MKRRIIAVLSFFVLGLSTAAAQTPEDQQNSLRQQLRSATNAVVTLATDDSLSAGSYLFKNSTSPDVELDLFKFVGKLPVGDHSSSVAPYVEISPAYLTAEQDLRDTANSRFELESWGLGVGAGARISLIDQLLELTPSFKLSYARINNKFFTDAQVDPLLKGIANADVDSWTYLPSLEVWLMPKVRENGARVMLGSKISYLYIDSSSNTSGIGSFSDQSWVWKNSLAFEHPLAIDDAEPMLFIRPAISRVDVSGAARDGLELNNFYEVGLELFSHSIASDVFAEVSFGATYLYEKEVQGWRFGFSARLA